MYTMAYGQNAPSCEPLSEKNIQIVQHFNYMTTHTPSPEVQIYGIVW